MRKRRVISVFALALVILANTSAASAAVLDGVSGQALVNRGSGYELAANGMLLKPGDIVVVNPGGAAQISYSDGCTVPVQIGAVVTVSENSPCGMTTGAVQTGPAAGVNGTMLVVGALVLGGVGLAVALNSGKDKPASP